MIRILYKTVKDIEVVDLDEFKVGTWVHAESPSEEELERLRDRLKLDVDLMKDSLDPNEVPRLELDGNNLYLYTRVPVSDEARVLTVPLLIVLSSKCIVTVSSESLPVVNKFLNSGLA